MEHVCASSWARAHYLIPPDSQGLTQKLMSWHLLSKWVNECMQTLIHKRQDSCFHCWGGSRVFKRFQGKVCQKFPHLELDSIIHMFGLCHRTKVEVCGRNAGCVKGLEVTTGSQKRTGISFMRFLSVLWAEALCKKTLNCGRRIVKLLTPWEMSQNITVGNRSYPEMKSFNCKGSCY